jgi:hypothetical protein
MFGKIKKIFSDLWSILCAFFRKISESLKDLSYKSKHLYETNIDNGLYHLKKGNLWDAVFRFKIVSVFWKGKEEGKYYFAYCLVLIGKINDAKSLLGTIPNFSKTEELLTRLENGEGQNIIKEWKEQIEK